MSADRKALRNSIQSTNAMLHLTRAMGMVASSKIRRASERMMNSRQYRTAFGEAIALLTASAECRRSPYLLKREGGRARLIVIAGDRGLAGGYNNNIFRAVAELEKECKCEKIIPIGRRACGKYLPSAMTSSEHYTPADASNLIHALCADYLNDEFDRLGIISTEYISLLTQTPKIEWILPLVPAQDQTHAGVIFEPDEQTILDSAVPEFLTGVLCAAVRESFACEVVARRNAMDSAGRNAKSMIDDLTLAYNRARQSAITQEITEIVAGTNV